MNLPSKIKKGGEGAEIFIDPHHSHTHYTLPSSLNIAPLLRCSIDRVQHDHRSYRVKGNKKVFIDHVLNQFTGEPPNNPVAVFMAGTPGAGKTELALSLIDIFDHSPVHIDADNFRQFIPGYNGSNSEIVQSAGRQARTKLRRQESQRRSEASCRTGKEVAHSTPAATAQSP